MERVVTLAVFSPMEAFFSNRSFPEVIRRAMSSLKICRRLVEDTLQNFSTLSARLL